MTEKKKFRENLNEVEIAEVVKNKAQEAYCMIKNNKNRPERKREESIQMDVHSSKSSRRCGGQVPLG